MPRQDPSPPHGTVRPIQHVGEWMFELESPTFEGLLQSVAQIIARAGYEADTGLVESAPWEPISLVSRDRASLVVDWANELIGRSEITGLRYTELRDLEVREGPSGTCELTGQVRGTPARSWSSPLKAATNHLFSLDRRPDGWRAVLLFDV